MARLLYRIGRFSFRHRFAVLAGWLAVLGGVALLAHAVERPSTDQFSIPGTESQRAMDLLVKDFPSASGASAQIVVAAPKGQTILQPGYVNGVLATTALAAKVPGVISASSPYQLKTISKDGRIGFIRVAWPYEAWKISKAAQNDLSASAAPARAAGLEVAFGGGIVNSPSRSASEGLGIMIAFAILAIAIGSLLGGLLPIASSLIGVGIGLMAINAFGSVVQLSATAPILAEMLGLAVGFDYALFIISRYRQLARDGLEPEEAIGRAAATAGSAVVFAGLTVIIALASLAALDIPFLSVMGFAAAGTVLIAVLVANTLIPALIGIAGRRVENGLLTRFESQADVKLGRRWAGAVTRHPWVSIIVAVAVLLVMAFPARGIDLGLPDAGSQPPDTTQRQAYDLLTEGFGPGFNGPLTVVVKAPTSSQASKLAEVAAYELMKAPGVQTVTPPQQNASKTLTVIGVIPASDPTSQATADLVAQIRKAAKPIQQKTGVEVLVTGQTAMNIDVADKLNAALPEYAAIVLILALLLLTLVFRSLVVPVKAALGFVLSVAAALGAVVFVFQEGHLGQLVDLPQAGPIISFLPVLLIGILFGLAMDYEVFLVSRMRERFSHGEPAREAVAEGVGDSARVVTAAAIIMFSVFASFVFSDDPIIKSIGLVLAIGVLADAFLVRMTIVPAVMWLLDRNAWWLPGWLQRHLPNVDIEGAGLEQPGTAPSEPAA